MDIVKAISARDTKKLIDFPKCKISIYYMADDKSSSKLLDSLKSGYKKANIFFNHDLKNKIDIVLVYSRDEMDETMERKTQAWEIGFTNNSEGNIVIFSPSVVENHSNHKKADIFKTIKHEIVHTFQTEIVKGFTPWWLDEGIAMIIADQKKVSGKERLGGLLKTGKFFNYTTENYRFCISNGGYSSTYYLVQSLINDFGKGKIRSLFDNSCTSKNFDDFFEKKLGVLPSDYAEKLA